MTKPQQKKETAKKETIFITGVAGFLGSHLADRFLADGYNVRGCDNLLGGYRDNVPKGVEFYEVDLLDHTKVVEITKGVDIVYHAAATAYEGFSVFSPFLVTQNIVGASTSIITASIQNKVRRFVFCSSMARYGAQEVPFREDMPVRPQDPYAIGKVASEQMLRNLAEIHGMEYVIAVPHNIIGPRQKYDDPYRNVASIMINRMLRYEQPIIYGNGEQKRCFSFVQDDVMPLARLATAPLNTEIINIGPDEEFVTINELAEVIAGQLNFNLDPIYMDDRPQEVKLATCSADKARDLLDYRTTYTLEKGIAENIEYIRKRGPKPFEYHLPLEIVNDKTPRTWREQLL
jgi:UDP-glucose 4-epimerase